jgi:hypothetical protein
VGSTEFAEKRLNELRTSSRVHQWRHVQRRPLRRRTPSLRDFVRGLAADMPGIEPPEDLEAQEARRTSCRSGLRGLPTLSLELLFRSGWSFGAYHSNYDNHLDDAPRR